MCRFEHVAADAIPRNPDIRFVSAESGVKETE